MQQMMLNKFLVQNYTPKFWLILALKLNKIMKVIYEILRSNKNYFSRKTPNDGNDETVDEKYKMFFFL